MIFNKKGSQFYKEYKWYLYIIVFATSFGLYLNTLNHSFVLDDGMVIVNNKHVLDGIKGVKDIFSNSYLHGFDGKNVNTYRPISLFSFALENHFFGNSPSVYHFFNILSYSILCILVSKFIFQIFPENKAILPITIIGLFITHPVHSEVVSNIKSRDEIYSMLFGITSLIYLLKHDSNKNRASIYFSLLFFTLSILSKENTLTLIGIFPLTLYFFKEEKLTNAIIKSTIYLIPILLFFILRLVILDDIILTNSVEAKWETPYNNTLFAANNYIEELATNFSIFLKYIQLSILPINLVSDYSINTFQIVNFSNIYAILGLASFSLLTYLAISTFKSRSKVSYSILFFLITFSITSNFIIKIPATLAERFLFLPSLGMIILITITLFKSTKSNSNKSIFYLIPIIAIIGFYTNITLNRNKDWKDNYTLYSQDFKSNPESVRIIAGLAQEKHKIDVKIKNKNKKLQEGKITENLYLQTLKNYPNKDFIYYKLGYLKFAMEDFNSAIEYFKKALPAKNIKEHEVYYMLGLCFENLNNNNESISNYEKAIELNPNEDEYWRHIGYVYFAAKKYKEAIDSFIKSVTIKGSSDINDLTNIAVSYHSIGDYSNAKKYYTAILKIDPNNSTAKKNISTLP